MISTSPLVSVVLPVYNHQRFVRQALDSVFQQTYPRIELIVVDDGSQDESLAIVHRRLPHSPYPYHILQQPNQGAYGAINNGIIASGGKYLAILNSDDLYDPDRIMRMVRALEGKPARFAYSKVVHIDEEGKPLAEDNDCRYYYQNSLRDAGVFPTFSFELIRHNFAVSTGNFIFQMSLFHEVGSFRPYQTCHDWDFLLRVILREEPLFVEEDLYYYRIHSQNTLSKKTEVREVEIDEVIGSYLRGMNQARNPLAPSPENWGSYWSYFSQQYLGHFYICKKAAPFLRRKGADDQLSKHWQRVVERISRLLNKIVNLLSTNEPRKSIINSRRKLAIYRFFGWMIKGLFPRIH